jgi:TRAP-type C4-dicarboxylate transport system substrate-binding protein
MVPRHRFVCRVIVAAALSMCMGSSAQAAEEIVLKFADTHPLTHFLSVNGHQAFMKKVEQLTAGKVKFVHYPAEQLGKEKDMLELGRKGIADIVFTGAGQSTGKLPLGGGADLPGLGADVIKNTRAYQILLNSNTVVVDEFLKMGLHPIMGFMYPPYQILSGSKPVQKIADLKGLKIRINSPVMGSAIEALGGTPVMLTSPEVFEGLQRGTVDGTTFSYISGKSWKLEEVIKAGTVGIDVGTVGSFWAINENTWKKLPDDVKNAIRKASDETSASMAAAADKEEKGIIAEWEQKGKTLYHLTAADQAEWGKKVRPAIEQWITTMEGRGLPARKSVEQLWKIRAELN